MSFSRKMSFLKNSLWGKIAVIVTILIYMGVNVYKVNPAGVSTYVSLSTIVIILSASMFCIAKKYNGNRSFATVFTVCLILSIAFRSIFFNASSIEPININNGFITMLLSIVRYSKNIVLNSPSLNFIVVIIIGIIISILITYVVSKEGKFKTLNSIIPVIEKKFNKRVNPRTLELTAVILLNIVMTVIGKLTGSLLFNELIRINFIYGITQILLFEISGISQSKFYLSLTLITVSMVFSYLLLSEVGFMICAFISGAILLLIYTENRKAVYRYLILISVIAVFSITILFSMPLEKINTTGNDTTTVSEKADENLTSKAIARINLFKNRAYSWVSNTENEYGKQIIIGEQAIALGGLTGCDKEFSFKIPYERNDMILSFISLHYGFLTVLFIIIILAAYFLSAFSTATHVKPNNKSIFLCGLAVSFAIQIIVQIFGCLGIIPFTGIGIPFISSGDSSLIIMLASSLYFFLSSTNIMIKE